jgi:hypothetical protein
MRFSNKREAIRLLPDIYGDHAILLEKETFPGKAKWPVNWIL